jgi:excisionase family DNA binding protein
MSLPKLYTSDEVCEYLGIKRSTLRSMVSSGKIVCIRVGRTPRFTEEQIRDYLEARQPIEKPTVVPVTSGASRLERFAIKSY